MTKRTKKNPFPPKKPATNSGIFSNSGAGQKMDPVKRDKAVQRAYDEAHRNTNSKSIAY